MSAPMHGQVEVSGFSVIPVKSTEQSTACHYIYAKEHAVRDTNPKKPRNRTLFLLNVPPYCSEDCIRRVFSKYGKIENIFIHKNPTSGLPVENKSEFFPTAAPVTGFKVVYIVFKNAAAVQRVLKHPFDDPILLSSPEHPLLTSIQKWCTEYVKQAPRPEDMQNEATEYLAAFDKRQEEEEEKERDAGEPDEEGWVTVTRHSRHKGAPRTEAQERKVSIKEKKKRKRKELLNFYAFQVRETKKEQIADLRQRFEEDKQKIALMKASRKFRPY